MMECKHEWTNWDKPIHTGGYLRQYRSCNKCGQLDSRADTCTRKDAAREVIRQWEKHNANHK